MRSSAARFWWMPALMLPRCQLRRLASDGVLLGASKYTYRAGITGLIQAAGPAAALPRSPGWSPEIWRNGWACPTVAALARDRSRQRRVPGSRCQPGASPGRGADYGPRGGRGIPAAWPGGNRAGPGHGALLRRRDHPQLHRPARLRPHLSGWHSGSGRPHATGKTDAVRLLNAIEVPWQPASPPELTIGPGICKPPVPPAVPSPPRRQGEGPGRVGPWSVARAPVVGWTGCYERAPGRRGVTGPGPRTAQSRSARRGVGASRLSPARVGSQRAGQVDDASAVDVPVVHDASMFVKPC